MRWSLHSLGAFRLFTEPYIALLTASLGKLGMRERYLMEHRRESF